MAKNKRNLWENDFSEFLASKVEEVPSHLSAQVFSHVHKELNPTALSVFAKISLIHFVSSMVTLVFCPQFGISLTSNMGIMPYLMKYGEGVCMLGCGAVFTGLSFFAASLFLRPEQVLVFHNNRILQLSLLSTLSLGAFLCMGGSVVASLGMIWIVGAVLGGVLASEVGWFFRQRLARRTV